MSHDKTDWEFIEDCAHKEKRPIHPIRKIVIKGAVDVVIRRSDITSLVVAGDTPDSISTLKTEFEGDVLVIEREGVNISVANGSVVINDNHGMVAGRNIVIHNGSGTMTFKGGVGAFFPGDVDIVNGKPIGHGLRVGGDTVVVGLMLPESPAIEIRGSGNAYLQDIKQTHLNLEVAGSGDITVQGEVKHLQVEIVGSGDVDARDLVSDEAELMIAGSGDIKAYIRSRVDARVAGSGDIKVYGNPPIRDQRVAGSGNIKFR